MNFGSQQGHVNTCCKPMLRLVTTLIDGVFCKVNSATSDRLQLLYLWTKTIDKERYEGAVTQPKLERNSFYSPINTGTTFHFNTASTERPRL